MIYHLNRPYRSFWGIFVWKEAFGHLGNRRCELTKCIHKNWNFLDHWLQACDTFSPPPQRKKKESGIWGGGEDIDKERRESSKDKGFIFSWTNLTFLIIVVGNKGTGDYIGLLYVTYYVGLS